MVSKAGHISKKDRRELRNNFYGQIEEVVKIRNICLHDDPSWKHSMTPEIAILTGLECAQMEVRDKKSCGGDPHLSPLCRKMEASFYEITARMRTTWNMVLATAVAASPRGEAQEGQAPLRSKRRLAQRDPALGTRTARA